MAPKRAARLSGGTFAKRRVDIRYQRQPLSMWTIYDHPRDYPQAFVARRFEVSAEIKATRDVRLFASLAACRADMPEMGLTRLDRQPPDDAVIVEVWL
jgi:hypothetical protein